LVESVRIIYIEFKCKTDKFKTNKEEGSPPHPKKKKPIF